MWQGPNVNFGNEVNDRHKLPSKFFSHFCCACVNLSLRLIWNGNADLFFYWLLVRLTSVLSIQLPTKWKWYEILGFFIRINHWVWTCRPISIMIMIQERIKSRYKEYIYYHFFSGIGYQVQSFEENLEIMGDNLILVKTNWKRKIIRRNPNPLCTSSHRSPLFCHHKTLSLLSYLSCPWLYMFIYTPQNLKSSRGGWKNSHNRPQCSEEDSIKGPIEWNGG